MVAAFTPSYGASCDAAAIAAIYSCNCYCCNCCCKLVAAAAALEVEEDAKSYAAADLVAFVVARGCCCISVEECCLWSYGAPMAGYTVVFEA